GPGRADGNRPRGRPWTTDPLRHGARLRPDPRAWLLELSPEPARRRGIPVPAALVVQYRARTRAAGHRPGGPRDRGGGGTGPAPCAAGLGAGGVRRHRRRGGHGVAGAAERVTGAGLPSLPSRAI